MALLTWDENLSVGLPSIDAAHKRWFDLINNLHDAMKTGRGKEIMQPILTEMFEFTQEHFATEEALMQQHNYPGYLYHKGQHDAFVARMQDLQRRHLAGDITLTMELMSTWKEWLLNHVQGVDKKYGPYLKSKGVN